MNQLVPSYIRTSLHKSHTGPGWYTEVYAFEDLDLWPTRVGEMDIIEFDRTVSSCG